MIKRALISGLLVLCLLTLSACVSPNKDIYPPANCEDTRTVYIVSHGWHTGFVIDVRDMDVYLQQVRQDFDGARFIEIGWGDKGFYQSPAVTSGLTLQAILWPTDSILHVVGLVAEPQLEFPHSEVLEVQVSTEGLRNMLTFIDQTFQKQQQQVIRIDNGLYGWSRFYQATGSYHLFNTCNNWVARGLRQTGFPITYTYAATAGNVMYQVDRYAATPLNCNGQ